MKIHEIFVVCFILFLILLLVGASANQKASIGETDAPLEAEPPPQELPPPEEPPPPENESVPLPPVENETLSFFVTSTELIDFTAMTNAQINTFLSLCYNQGIPELTVRLRAMDIATVTAPPAAEVAKVKTIITTATSLGITVNLDMHTWYTTWDNYFRDAATMGPTPRPATMRTKYINYVKAAINAFDGYSAKAWMVLNEPQARTATTSENNFILAILTAAAGETSEPLSVRFMGGYSPTTGHYATAIDTACDFLCRNMYWTGGSYWDPRNSNPTAENAMLAALAAADAAGKECWITEFGGTKSNLETQRSKVAASVDWFQTKGFERVYCWVSQPVGGSGENYNIFTGMTPNPAFYELVSSEEGGPETYTKQLTFGSHLQANYSKTFTFGAWLVTPPETEPVPKTFTFGAHLQAGYSKTFTFGAHLQLSDDYPYPDVPAVSSTLFQDVLAQFRKVSSPRKMVVT